MPAHASQVRVQEAEPGGLGSAERWCIRQVLRALGDPSFSLAAWNGEEFAPRGASPQGRLRLREHIPALRLPWTREWIYGGAGAGGEVV